MNTRVDKTTNDRSRQIANAYSQERSGKTAANIEDRRREAATHETLQNAADSSPQSRQLKARQDVVNSARGRAKPTLQHASLPTPTIQRLLGAADTAQEGEAVPFTLDDDFRTKHIATDLADAKRVTEDRIATGKPPGMVAGIAPNSLATEAVWEKAIEDSEAVVPPEGEWSLESGDDGQFVNQLAWVEVPGWEAKGKAGAVVAKATTVKNYVGGTWKVSESEFDEEDVPVKGKGKVEMDISHVTS